MECGIQHLNGRGVRNVSKDMCCMCKQASCRRGGSRRGVSETETDPPTEWESDSDSMFLGESLASDSMSVSVLLTLQRSWLERRQVRISEALWALLCFRDSRQHLQETDSTIHTASQPLCLVQAGTAQMKASYTCVW